LIVPDVDFYYSGTPQTIGFFSELFSDGQKQD